MNTKRFLAVLLSLAMLVTALGGCQKAPPASSTAASSAPTSPVVSASTEAPKPEKIMFTDSCGREVELPSTLTRIAPSGAAAQMILYSVAPDALMGWSSLPSKQTLAYFPEKFATLPEFGQFYGKNVSLNMESLIAANPQVIIDLGDKKPTHKEDMDAIQQQTGIPTIFIEANLATFPTAYRTLGTLLGASEQGEKLATYLEKTINEAKTNAAKIPDAERITVFFGAGKTGLDANARGSIHADVIDLIGAVNAVVVPEISNKGGGNTINMEQLLNFDPDVVLLMPNGPFSTLGTDTTWSGLRAIKDNKFYEIPSGPYNWMSSPPSVNRILGIKWLGNLLYPTIYSYDMADAAKEFYQLFWHYDLKDEQVTELLKNSTAKAHSVA
ncbi:MAG: ABC transporter substrate-binding protein [Oscillospiraceae bacterium]